MHRATHLHARRLPPAANSIGLPFPVFALAQLVGMVREGSDVRPW